MRFSVEIPQLPTVAPIDLELKADDELHARSIIANMLGDEAARAAIVREIDRSTPALLRFQCM